MEKSYRSKNCKMVNIKCIVFALITMLASTYSQIYGQLPSQQRRNTLDKRAEQSKLPPIQSVTIEKNGSWNPNLSSSNESSDICRDFVLSETEVKHFFNHSVRITGTQYVNDQYPSRCHATGKIVFSNGARGMWLINRSRAGEIEFEHGETWYFFGKYIKSKKYYEDIEQMPSVISVKNKSINKIDAIKSVEFISQNDFKWSISDKQKSGRCCFSLSKDDVITYLKHAKIMTLKEIGAIDSSDCHIEGEVEFTNGRKGVWMIESGRRGVLKFNDGGVVYLFGKDVHVTGFAAP